MKLNRLCSNSSILTMSTEFDKNFSYMKLILHWSQKLHWIFFRHFWSPKIDSDKSLQNLSLTKFGVRTWQSSMKNKYERFRDSLTFFLVYLRWLNMSKDMLNVILVIIRLLAFHFIMKSFYQIPLTWWKIYMWLA